MGTVDIKMPTDQQEGTESVVGQWLKKVGETVAAHEPLLEINTDKVVVEIAAPEAGVLRELAVREGEPVEPGQLLGRLQTSVAVESPVDQDHDDASQTPPAAQVRPGREERLSPAVRKLLKQNQLDPTEIPGSGRGGRITHHDVVQYLRTAGPAQHPDRVPSPGAGRRIPHTPMRKAIAQHMVESQLKTAPHVTSVFEADFSAILRHRRIQKEKFEKKGVKLTLTSYLIAAIQGVVREVPEINSRWQSDALELIEDCNIGIATALGNQGLLVPVIHQVQDLNLFGIASRLQRLTELARQGKLQSRHLEGGTITLTNHGVSGSLIATPIIHQPQSAIIGAGKVEKRVVVVDDDGGESLRIRPMGFLTATIDHRALDGFTANLFLAKMVAILEEWN